LIQSSLPHGSKSKPRIWLNFAKSVGPHPDG
jgi:hypothetical protein